MTEEFGFKLGELELDESSPIRLGAFELLERLGSGAMGEVFKARHREQGVTAAVKVIQAKVAGSQKFQQAFRHEVRSVAGLNHPFVVSVMDYGVVSEELEEQSMDLLRAGSPYLVMEYAKYGSLDQVIGAGLSWPVKLVVLYALLDALAHSHARGLVHRDIKPKNVLITSAMQGRVGLRLSDFGLAYALWEVQELPGWHRTAGTAEYMAPEQVTADWRRYGPETDLYGLGCLAYELISGKAPFPDGNIVQIAQAHLDRPVPRLVERGDAPAGIEEWLSALLAKAPEERFRSAAAAAVALQRIAGVPEGPEVVQGWREVVAKAGGGSSEQGKNGAGQRAASNSPLVVLEPHAAADTAGGEDLRATLPVPRCWERRAVPIPEVRLLDAGRGLFGMRRIPLKGREAERELLWGQLQRASEGGGPQVTLLEGSAGIGKDYLAEWLCDRALELDVAAVVRVYHDQPTESADALQRAMVRHFRVEGLTTGEVEERLREVLRGWGAEDRAEWEMAAELLAPRPASDPGPRVRFASQKHRDLTIANLLRRMTQEGPVVLWLKDIHWGPRTMEFVEVLVSESRDLPLMVVMTARDDLFAGTAAEEVFCRLGEGEAVVRRTLGGLEEGAMREMLAETLFLEPESVTTLSQRSGGNPLLALEVLRGWMDQGHLKSSPSGYAMTAEAVLAMPRALAEAWRPAVARVIEGAEECLPVLEAGAILGRGISTEIWEEFGRALGCRLPDRLLESLYEQRYIHDGVDGVVFTQHLFREALCESARRHGRLRELNELCAEVLERRGGFGSELEIAGHYLEGGRVEKGAGIIAAKMNELRLRGEFQTILHYTQLALRELEDAGKDASVPLRAELMRWRCHALLSAGLYDEGLEAARAMAALAESVQGCGRWLTIAWVNQGMCLQFQGGLREALTFFEKAQGALEHLKRPKDDAYLFGAYFIAGSIHRKLGEVKEARELIARGQVVAKESVDPLVRLRGWFEELMWAWRDGTLRRADFTPFLKECEKHRLLDGTANGLNQRAELARREGDLEAALADYHRSIEIYRLIDPNRGVAPKLNIGLVMLSMEDLQEAALIADRVLQDTNHRRRGYMRLMAMALKLPWVMRTASADEARELLREVEEQFKETPVVADKDLPVCLQCALNEADEKPPELADRLRGLLGRFQ